MTAVTRPHGQGAFHLGLWVQFLAIGYFVITTAFLGFYFLFKPLHLLTAVLKDKTKLTGFEVNALPWVRLTIQHAGLLYIGLAYCVFLLGRTNRKSHLTTSLVSMLTLSMYYQCVQVLDRTLYDPRALYPFVGLNAFQALVSAAAYFYSAYPVPEVHIVSPNGTAPSDLVKKATKSSSKKKVN